MGEATGNMRSPRPSHTEQLCSQILLVLTEFSEICSRFSADAQQNELGHIMRQSEFEKVKAVIDHAEFALDELQKKRTNYVAG